MGCRTVSQPEQEMSVSWHDSSGRRASPSTVLVVEDHQLLAHTLRLGLCEEGLRTVTSELRDADSVIEEASAVGADLVLLDLDLGRMGWGTDLIKPLRAIGAEVVVLTGLRDRTEIAAAIEAGAVGYVSKSSSFEELLEAIRDVAELGQLLSRTQRDQLLGELQAQRAERHKQLPRFADLSEAEQDILAALMEGSYAQEIASQRFVSLATVRTQIRSLLSKLGVNSQLAAVAVAGQAGWEPDKV